MKDKPLMSCIFCRKETIILSSINRIHYTLYSDGNSDKRDYETEIELHCPNCGKLSKDIYEYDISTGKFKWDILNIEQKQKLKSMLELIPYDHPFQLMDNVYSSTCQSLYHSLKFLNINIVNYNDNVAFYFNDYGIENRINVNKTGEMYIWGTIIRALAIMFTGIIPYGFCGNEQDILIDDINLLTKQERHSVYSQSNFLLREVCNDK